MRVGVAPTGLLERIVAASGKAPWPFLDTWFPFLYARAIMTATKLGIFEALEAGPLTGSEVAARCGTHEGATRTLLDALVATGYVRLDGSRYAIASIARRWMLRDSPQSLRDIVMHRFVDWEWLTHLEEFVRTGEALRIHATPSSDWWGVYQRGMRSLAALTADELARRTPVSPGARDLLDIGGSHGYYSVVLCRRYSGLRATILDLPQAIEHAAPLLAKEGMGDRVVYRPGNALTDDLGTDSYDVVLVAGLVHHFDEAQNRDLARRVARTLRAGGHYVIHSAIRPVKPKKGGIGPIAQLLDLYFALTSEAGLWSFEEMATWQRDAGLEPMKPIRFSLSGVGEQVGVKPGPEPDITRPSTNH
jgi:SAM-dependent methyltransferase